MLIPGKEYQLYNGLAGSNSSFTVLPERGGNLSDDLLQHHWEVFINGESRCIALVDHPFYIPKMYILITTLSATEFSDLGQRGEKMYFIEEIPDPMTKLENYLGREGLDELGYEY